MSYQRPPSSRQPHGMRPPSSKTKQGGNIPVPSQSITGNRPTTKQGLPSAHTTTGQRQVADSKFYIGILRTRINDIVKEIERLKAEIETRKRGASIQVSLQQEVADLRAQIAQSEAELADYNVLADRLSNKVSIDEMQASLSELKLSNSQLEKEADRLNALVDNMLLLSKIEFTEEAYRDNFETVNVASVLDEVFSMHESEAKKHGDALSVDYSENIFVKGDFTLLVIAVSNLVGNAIKYSADGSSVDIFAQRSGENVDIIVKDNGAGIAPAHIERLFERFYRVDKGRSRNMGGTGLGLAIAKHVAMLHGGTISVESAEGKGSIFKISLKTA